MPTLIDPTHTEISTLNEDLSVFENTRRESDKQREVEILNWHLNLQSEEIDTPEAQRIVDLVTNPEALLSLPRLRKAFYLPIDLEDEEVAKLDPQLLKDLDTEIPRSKFLRAIDPISRVRASIPDEEYIKVIDVVEAIRFNLATQIFAERQMQKAEILIKNLDPSILETDAQIVTIGEPYTIPEVPGTINGKTYVFLNGPEDPYMDPYREEYQERLAVSHRPPEKFLYFTIHERIHAYHDAVGLKILKPEDENEIIEQTAGSYYSPIEDISLQGLHNRIDRIVPNQKEKVATIGGALAEGTACVLTDLAVKKGSSLMPSPSKEVLEQVNEQALEALVTHAPPIYKRGYKFCRKLFEKTLNPRYLETIPKQQLATSMEIPDDKEKDDGYSEKFLQNILESI